MNCMKCGKETQQEQIFCPECLAEMEKYPVKPGIVVQIPVHPLKKQPHHRRGAANHEEQLKRLSRINRRLIFALVLTVLIAVFFALLSFDVLEKYSMHKLLGQNYSVAVSTEAPDESAGIHTEPTE